MLKFFRSKHSQYFVFIVFALLFASFLFYSQAGSNLLAGHSGGKDLGKIDGQDISPIDFRTAEIDVYIQEHQENEYAIWFDLLTNHDAPSLGVYVSNEQVVDAVHQMPDYQDSNGVYDPKMWQQYLALLFKKDNLTEQDFMLAQQRGLVASGVQGAFVANIHAPRSIIQEAFSKQFAPASVTLWKFNPAAYLKDAQVTPADALAEFKAHPERPEYRDPEQREVKYVLFNLSPEEAKLPPAAQEDLKYKLHAKADSFYGDTLPISGSSAIPPTFEEEAAKFNLPIADSGLFTVHTPAKGLPPSPHFNAAAFALTEKNPVSQTVEVLDGYAILKLDKVVPGQLKDFSALQASIIDTMKKAKATAAMSADQINLQYGTTPAAIQALVASGKVAETKLTVPAMEPGTPPPADVPSAVLQQLPKVDTGKISDPFAEDQNQPDRNLVMRVDSRQPVPDALRNMYWSYFRQRQDAQYVQGVTMDWLAWRTKQTGTVPPPDLRLNFNNL